MFYKAYIGYDRTDKEMEGRHCTCKETGNPNEFGDGSSLPCMNDMNGLCGYPDITCRNCAYCCKVDMNHVEVVKTTVEVDGQKKTLAVIGVQRDEIEDSANFFNYPADLKAAPGWIVFSKLVDSEEDFKNVELFAEQIKNAEVKLHDDAYGYEWIVGSINVEDDTDFVQYTWVENDFKLHSLQEAIDSMLDCGCNFF